jgi:hypothetical protein
MSPTPGAPESEPEIPDDSPEVVAAAADEPTTEEICLTEIDNSITDIIAITEVVQDATPLPRPEGRRGRPPRQTKAPITWSVRGVTRDTRTLLEQAAGRVGKTLGQYLNEDVRVCVEQQLHLLPPPASMVALQKQVHYLRQLVENLATMVRHSPPRPAADPSAGQ